MVARSLAATDCANPLLSPAGRRQVAEDMWVFTIQHERQPEGNYGQSGRPDRSRRMGHETGTTTTNDQNKPPDGLPSYDEAVKLPPPPYQKDVATHV